MKKSNRTSELSNPFAEGKLVNREELVVTIRESCDKPWLRALVTTGLDDIVDRMVVIAHALARLKVLGEDMSITVHPGMGAVYQRIAEGVLMPELVAFVGNINSPLFRYAKNLCPSEQKRVVGDAPIEVAEPNSDEFRMVRPLYMTSAEVEQVFHENRINSVEQQRGWLRDQVRESMSVVRGSDSLHPYEILRRQKKVRFKGVEFEMTQAELLQLAADIGK